MVPSVDSFVLKAAGFLRVAIVTDLDLKFQYRGLMMGSLTVSNQQGCRLYFGQLQPSPQQEDLFGPIGLQQVQVPGLAGIQNQKQQMFTERILDAMERGLILEIREQDIYAVRLCQCKVFWSGPGVEEAGPPNPLEREERVRVFSLNNFLEGIRSIREKRSLLFGRVPTSCGVRRADLLPERRSSEAPPLRDVLLFRGGLARPEAPGEETHHDSGATPPASQRPADSPLPGCPLSKNAPCWTFLVVSRWFLWWLGC